VPHPFQCVVEQAITRGPGVADQHPDRPGPLPPARRSRPRRAGPDRPNRSPLSPRLALIAEQHHQLLAGGGPDDRVLRSAELGGPPPVTWTGRRSRPGWPPDRRTARRASCRGPVLKR
jgi:hypothetical protein